MCSALYLYQTGHIGIYFILRVTSYAIWVINTILFILLVSLFQLCLLGTLVFL
jgi:hypothetical protein